MNDAAAHLGTRVTWWTAAFSLVTTLTLVTGTPWLLLLDSGVADAVSERQLLLLALAGVSAFAFVVARLRRHRYLLRALALGLRSIDPAEMEELGREPGRLTRRWLVPHLVAQAALIWLRPSLVDFPAATSVALLGGIIIGALSLLYYVAMRSQFLGVAELAPPDVMREAVETAEREGRARLRIKRRLRMAVATPVALVAIGTALISSAHVRRADEVAREATARVLARATLELGPGVAPEAGIEDAVARAAQSGFSARRIDDVQPFSIERSADGVTVLTTPLDIGSAVLSYNGSTVPILGMASLIVACLTVALAAALGSALGQAHTLDLEHATDGVRLLGTEAVISGGRLPVSPPRFAVVAELEAAIERLAERFRVFARAQERAILAREAATRTRGLFFASVSHDLKSPLNSILGFTELVRLEPLTVGQEESLDLIERRGRELLALIETILDAARVEAGQLSLVVERTPMAELFSDAFTRARDLDGDYTARIVSNVGLTEDVVVDRVRMGRALATLVAFAIRQTRAGTVNVRAQKDGPRHARIRIAMPALKRRTEHLRRLLAAAGRPGAGEHRGLALGLLLARTIIELHGGRLEVEESPMGDPTLSIRVPLPPA
jgi:signal transduction histidine kinase